MMYSFDVFDKVDSEYKYESIQTADFYDEANDEERNTLYVENLVERDEDWKEDFLDELFDL